MNPTDDVKHSPKEDRKEEAKQTELVLYCGRQVKRMHPKDDFYTGMTPHLSLLDRLWMSLNYIFEMEMFQQTSPTHAPQSFRAIVERIDQLSLVENVEDSKRYQQVLQKLQELFTSLCKGKQIALRLTGVSSMEELYVKQVELKLYKQAAERRYLRHPAYISKRKEIDLHLILALKHKISEQDQKIIEEYWDLLAAWPKTYIETTDQFMLDFDTLLLDLISSCLDIHQTKQYSTGDEFYHHFKELILEKLASSLQAKTACCNEFDKTVWDYIFLMGECQLEDVLRQKVRRGLRFRWQERKNLVEQVTLFLREKNQKKIESYTVQQLAKYQNYETLLGKLAEKIQKHRKNNPNISPIASARLDELCQMILQAKELIVEKKESQQEESLEDLNSSLNKMLKELAADDILSERLKSVLVRSLRDIVTLHKRIQVCLKKTDQDLMKLALKAVKRHLGETPDEIYAYIPQQTDFEKLMSDIREIENPNPFSIQEHPFNIVAFSLEIFWNMPQFLKNSSDYFFQQLEETDEKKLNLLSSRVFDMK